MAAAIKAIPDGYYSGERGLDNDGIEMDRGLSSVLTLKVNGEQLTFDFSRSDAQTRGFVNSPFANTASVCFQSLFACIGAAIPINAGSLRLISIVAPEGSIVHCRQPAPTTASTLLTCAAITDAIWIALAQAIPAQSQAGWGRRCAPMTAGFNPRTKRRFVCTHHNCKGGSGATEGFDGWNHTGPVSNMGGSRATDPEIFELAYPYKLLQYEYAPDTGGAGKWRGGMGADYSLAGRSSQRRVCHCGLRHARGYAGLRPFGAKPGSLPTMQVISSDATKRQLQVNAFHAINEGDICEVVSQGGGGFGDPLARDPEQIMRDVADGLVSTDKALVDYGVVIVGSGRR